MQAAPREDKQNILICAITSYGTFLWSYWNHLYPVPWCGLQGMPEKCVPRRLQHPASTSRPDFTRYGRLLSHIKNSYCMRVKAARIFLHLGRSCRMLKIHIVCGTLHLVYFLHSGRSCRILKIRMVSGPRLFGCSFILGASVAYEKFVWYAGHGASDIIIFGHATVSKTSDFQLIYFRICGISGEHCVNKRMPQGGGT